MPAQIEERAVKAVKTERVVILHEMTVAEAFVTIVSACVTQFRNNEQLIVGERDPDGLHQARLALRRLRSAFSLFRDAVDGAEYDRLRDELRWLLRRLGEARDFDMILERELADEESARLEPKRERAYNRAIAAIDSGRCRLLFADLLDWQTHGDWRSRRIARKRIAKYARRRIDHLWWRVRRTKRISRMTERERHRLRNRTKTLRYALRFLAALYADVRERRKKFSKTVRGLQEALGELNDMAIARTLLAAVPSPAVAERALIDDATEAMGRLKRIGPYWRR